MPSRSSSRVQISTINTTQRGLTWKGLLPWIISIVILLGVIYAVNYSQTHLGRPALWSGYSLLVILILLSLFHVRKRLSMIPLGRAYWWQKMHIALGVLSIALFMTHVDNWWPAGVYERWLASFFYIAVASGIIGYLLQMLIPARITQTRDEIIVERIADVISDLRDTARESVERSLSKSNTIMCFYVETFDDYFRRPRFITNHLLGGRLAEHWLNNKFQVLEQYCNAEEMEFVEELKKLAISKSHIDSHYAHMLLLKLWLFIHIPAVVGLIALISWHWLLVNIYAL